MHNYRQENIDERALLSSTMVVQGARRRDRFGAIIQVRLATLMYRRQSCNTGVQEEHLGSTTSSSRTKKDLMVKKIGTALLPLL